MVFYFIYFLLLSSLCPLGSALSARNHHSRNHQHEKIDLSTTASLSEGYVYFNSPEPLENCHIYHNRHERPDINIEYMWQRIRGRFRINSPGHYRMSCDMVWGWIHVGQLLWDAHVEEQQHTTTPPPVSLNENTYNGNIPTLWRRVSVFVREPHEIGNFDAFYDRGAVRLNVSRESALAYINEIVPSMYSYRQIYVEPVYDIWQPAMSKVAAVTTPSFVNTSPLLDGTMGWMKALNFSAHDRICGQGAAVHFYDNGYHVQHEDIHGNSHIYLRSQIEACENFTRICDHGTASLGLLAATKNEFGIEGLARCADSINLYSYGHPIDDVLNYAKPGDIYGINVQYCLDLDAKPEECKLLIPFTCIYPHLVNRLANRGIIVVQAAGNGNINLDGVQSCQNQYGRLFGFVVSASLRNTDKERDMGITVSDTRSTPGVFTNYNHPNTIYSGWGNKVVTTLAASGDIFYAGRNRGYGTFSGTSSATPLITGVLTVLQGYMRTRCPNMFLNYENFEELAKLTGDVFTQRPGMGYSPNVYTALEFIETNYVKRCREKLEDFPLEQPVPSYDDLYDGWHLTETDIMARCSDNNIDFLEIDDFPSENHLIAWTDNGKKRNLVLCQTNTDWGHKVIYLPAVTRAVFEILQNTTITFIRESTYEFRVARTFGIGTWQLGFGARLTMKLDRLLPRTGYSQRIIEAKRSHEEELKQQAAAVVVNATEKPRNAVKRFNWRKTETYLFNVTKITQHVYLF